jgi:hypothetical protein
MPELHSLVPLEFLGLGSSGLEYNESYILSRWPRLVNHGDHFRSQDVDFDTPADPKYCIGGRMEKTTNDGVETIIRSPDDKYTTNTAR